MVNSIGSPGPNVLNIAGQSALTRGSNPPALVSSGADEGSVRIDVSAGDRVAQLRDALIQAQVSLDLAVAVGREVLNVLGEATDLAARASDPAAPQEARDLQQGAFDGVLSRLTQIVARAIHAGAEALAGRSVLIEADPNGAPFEVAGLDLRLKDTAGPDDVLILTQRHSVRSASDATLAARAGQESVARVAAGLVRLDDAASRLTRHETLPSALDGAGLPSPDLDADGARLLALQVRQSLAAFDGAPFTAAQKALLSYFRETS
jgi:hypothetical protein